MTAPQAVIVVIIPAGVAHRQWQKLRDRVLGIKSTQQREK